MHTGERLAPLFKFNDPALSHELFRLFTLIAQILTNIDKINKKLDDLEARVYALENP